MSDWFMYELDNIRWDEVAETDDHIVPHTATEQEKRFLGQGGSHEKAKCGVVSVGRKNEDIKSVAEDGIQGREGTCCASVEDIKASILRKYSWSSSPDGVFLDSSNTHQEIAGFTCNDAKVPNNCLQSNSMSLSGNELCEIVTYGNRETETETDRNSCRFQFDNMFPTGNDLNFFANEHEEKDCTDFLYYRWPDVANFQETDRMFSCDLTFRQGISNYDNEVSWLSSSSCAIDKSEDAFKSNFNSPLPESKSTSKQSERNIKFMCDNLSPSSTNYEKRNGFDTCCMNSRTLNADDSFTQGLSYHNLLDADFEDMRVAISNEQINMQRKSNAGNQSEGEREDQSLEYFNGGSFHGSGMRHQLKYTSSYALNHSLPMEMSSNSSMKPRAMALEERIENVHQHQQMQATLTNVSQSEDSMANQDQTALADLVSTKKQLQQGHDGVGGVCLGEVDSSAKESPSMSMLLGDFSLEGTSSFWHLQCIMKQLDIRTKLCIRDSLYRLARSAEQRLNRGNSNSSGIENRDERGLLTTEEANVSSGFMDSEADTNLIDRSVAHLLFRSPSEPSPRPSNDSFLWSLPA